MFSPCNSYCSLVFVLVLCGALLGQEESSDGQLKTESHHCPTWTYFNNDTHSCQCGPIIHRIILCNMEDGNLSDVGVLHRFCMTQNKERRKIVVGPCPYNNEVEDYHEDTKYASLPSNVTELDTVMCGDTSRNGQLCGQCMEGHSPPVYSYYPQCVNCTAGTNNWAKYLAVSLLPTTAFFIGALVFRFRATSPLLNGYILFCQIVTSPPVLRLVAYSIHNNVYVAQDIRIVSYICSAYQSIWNLDFFRLAYTPFCLHPNASTLQVLSLDYIIAAYPLALIILTYTLVRLHYNNCTLVVWLWRPFISCFARCRRQWDIQNSLVDAFATFLLLSYIKFLSVSFDILMPTFSWDIESTIQPLVVYYDGTIEYFGLALCSPGHCCSVSVHLSPHPHLVSLSLSLLSEVPEQIPPQQPDPPHFHGHLSGQFQRWHKRNQRLPIFCSSLFDHSCGAIFVSRNLHCHFQQFHDKWCPSCFCCVT